MTNDKTETGRIGEADEKPIKIDVKDRKILTFLENDSRMSLTQIAKKVALSRDAVNYRIKRLVDKEVILRFFPEINFKKLGYHLFHVFILVDEQNAQEKEQLISELREHPNIISVIEYSDRWDLRIVFIAKDIREFDCILTDLISKHPMAIVEKETLSVIREFCNTYLPNSYKNTRVDEKKRKNEEDISPDEKDIQILRILSKDCRVSTYDISRSIKLSADAIGYRIKKLVSCGIIKKFTVLVNFSKIRYSWYTYGVHMKRFDQQTEWKFKEFCQEHPFIIRSMKTQGNWDLLLFILADNSENFHKTIKELKTLFADSIRNYETWIAYTEHHFENFPAALHGAAKK